MITVEGMSEWVSGTKAGPDRGPFQTPLFQTAETLPHESPPSFLASPPPQHW